MQIEAQIDQLPEVQEVSSAVQIQGQKGDVQKQTDTQTAMQTHAAIQI